MEKNMDKEDVEKIEELLDDSLETLADKKRFAKTMNTIIKEYRPFICVLLAAFFIFSRKTN